MQEIPIRNDFEPRFFDEIGRLVVAFGRVEYLVKLCLKQLSGKGFTVGMEEAEKEGGFKSLCCKVKNLAGSKLPSEQATDFCQLIEMIDSLAEKRNDNVHALWTVDDSGAPLRIRPKWDKKEKIVDWTRGRIVHLEELQIDRQHLQEAHHLLEQQRKRWPELT